MVIVVRTSSLSTCLLPCSSPPRVLVSPTKNGLPLSAAILSIYMCVHVLTLLQQRQQCLNTHQAQSLRQLLTTDGTLKYRSSTASTVIASINTDQEVCLFACSESAVLAVL
jgi:hypothetical protein